MLQNGQLMGPITIMTQPNNFAANKSPPSTQANSAPTSTATSNPSNLPNSGVPLGDSVAVKTEVCLVQLFSTFSSPFERSAQILPHTFT